MKPSPIVRLCATDRGLCHAISPKPDSLRPSFGDESATETD